MDILGCKFRSIGWSCIYNWVEQQIYVNSAHAAANGDLMARKGETGLQKKTFGCFNLKQPLAPFKN